MNQHTQIAIEGLPPLSAENVTGYLAPWLDGALEPVLAAQTADIVGRNPELGRLAEALETLGDALPDAFGSALMAPIPQELMNSVTGIGLLDQAHDVQHQRQLDEAKPIFDDWGASTGVKVFAVALTIALSAFCIGLGYELSRDNETTSVEQPAEPAQTRTAG